MKLKRLHITAGSLGQPFFEGHVCGKCAFSRSISKGSELMVCANPMSVFYDTVVDSDVWCAGYAKESMVM